MANGNTDHTVNRLDRMRQMIRAEADDLVRPPADVLAQMMLECVRDSPSLIRRSRGHGKSVQTQGKLSSAIRPEPAPPLTLLANADPAIRQYLEDLVSIGVASAERADDALQEAQSARRKATRAMLAFASFAAIGVAAGTAGLLSVSRVGVADSRLVELAGQVQSLNDKQLAASHQLAAVSSAIADERETVEAGRQTAAPAQQDDPSPVTASERQPGSMPASQPNVTPRASPVQRAIYSSPWPIHTQPERRAWSAQPRQAPVPRFIYVIQQNLRALFR